jgi:sugar transferase (PEP-CTERM/EpsH1 system associated)
MKPLIAHVVHRFGVGGLENGLVNLVNRMPADRWRHAIIALTDVSEAFRSRIQRDDVTYHSLHKPAGHLVKLYPHLVQLFRNLSPAIVHTRNLAALEACVPAWAAGVPIRIHSEHGWDVHDLGGSSRKYTWVRRLYRPFVHCYVALSRDLDRYLVSRVGIAPTRVIQIYNGVDTAAFRPATGSRCAIPGCSFNDPSLWIVGTVGRMEPVKDQLNLARAFIRAVEIAPETRRHLRLVMVGEGRLRPEVRRLLQQAGLADLAWLPGERGDVADVMRGLDCFVLPSLAEGISNTILEAMASGVPVVATRAGGNVELVQEGVTGRLVPAADPDALARAILDYYLDREAARKHAQAARRIAKNKFGLDRMVTSYMEVYEQLLAERVWKADEQRDRPGARITRA